MPQKPGFGELAPNFTAATPSNAQFHFDTVAGRNVVLVFVGHPLTASSKALVEDVRAHRAGFDDGLVSLFYVVSDPADIAALGLRQETPGIRYFMDWDGAIARAYGYAAEADADGAPPRVECGVVVLDRGLRTLQSGVTSEPKPQIEAILDGLRRLDAVQQANPNLNHAPVLVVERVFEPAFCRRLIQYYGANEAQDSGFMREKDGYTVGVLDHSFKSRRDVWIEDDGLMRAGMVRVHRRLVPEIKRAFQFEITRIERHIVACYEAERGGFFRPHRDNTTKGTAHRRFALSINLNAEEFEGGEVRFPEFGPKGYKAPTGGAVVFSCSLLHEVVPVTRGVRYVYLPFLYNDEDARLRQENKRFLDRRSGGFAEVPSVSEPQFPARPAAVAAE